MSQVIDRRLNSGDKNLPNKERFKQRNKAAIQKAVKEIAQKRSISDTKGESITIDQRGITEPTFRRGNTGDYNVVGPGNREYLKGDHIRKNSGGGGSGSKGTKDGDGEDNFKFLLTEEEYLDALFADLALPHFIKKSLTGSDVKQIVKAGYTPVGSPANMSILRTMGNSLKRRIALNRPDNEEIEQYQNLIDSTDDPKQKELYQSQLDELLRYRSVIPFIDTMDVRYRNTILETRPKSKAVIFAIMDVSGSMQEHEKDLAKRFFLLLHVFLKRNYEKVDIVFVMHTQDAEIVDEKTFFYSTHSGGTVVSSALELANKTIEEKYNPNEWNIYVAQASDGDNYTGDEKETLEQAAILLEYSQYFAYVEIKNSVNHMPYMMSSTGEKELWKSYLEINQTTEKKIAMKKVTSARDIFPVFAELFSKTVK